MSCLECSLLCLRGAVVSWDLLTMTLPLRILKNLASLLTFLWCNSVGHSSLLILKKKKNDTTGVVVLVDDKSSHSSLNCLSPVDILFGVRIPHCAGI